MFSLFQKRFEGTLVNPETFFAWKASFDAEFAHLKTSRERDTGKLTGREMFMRDKTLVESDLKFLEDSEGNFYICWNLEIGESQLNYVRNPI